MRYIDINRLEQAALDVGWNAIRQAHLDALQNLSVDEKKAYISAHNDWNLFQPAMLNLSHNKCWYSEAPIGNSDFEIDHFRPKNGAKNHDGSNTKINGYWWKAYDWDNYRLTGALANKRRRDRLGQDIEVHGKGVYFPLDLNAGSIAADEASINCEVPMLLDPTDDYDVTLISFDERGEPIPSTENDYEVERVKQSILYYHLDLEQLNKERKMTWEDSVLEIKDAKQAIDDSPNEAAKRLLMKKCFRKLKNYVSNHDRPYTSVVRACISVYSELEGYGWLKNLVRTI